MGKRKQVTGKVISTKMDKTVVVELERIMMHSLYKMMRKMNVLLAIL
jgi:ribosomal protein S17